MLNILNVAQSGLAASQTQVENVMNNIANENTPGYKSRVVDVSEIEHADSRLTGRGISVDDISRKTNIYMYQNLIKEDAKLSDVKELNFMLSDIESIFYETEDAGLSADLNKYFQSIENLRTSPENAIYKSNLTNNANILVENMQTIYNNIETRENTTLTKVENTVDVINTILTNIGDLSKQISDSLTTPNDLLDKRDNLEKDLAQYVDVEISRENTYELKIGGITAVRFDTNVHTLNLVENYSPQQDAYIFDINDSGYNPNAPQTSNLVSSTWGQPIGATSTQEEQNIPISGTATGQVVFLGHNVAGANGTAGHQTPAEIINDITNDDTNIINTWNAANPTKEIASLSAVDLDADGTNDAIQIKYENTEGNTPEILSDTSAGITFANSIEITRGGETSATSEVQTMSITGAATGQVFFLNTLVGSSANGDSAIDTATKIASAWLADTNGIKTNWNNDPANSTKQIDTITADTAGNLTITYKPHMEDVAVIDETSSRGITYNRSVETTKGTPEDSVTYTLNNTYDITVTHGEVIYEADGITPADINNDGVADAADIVDKDNIIQALVYKINQDKDIGGTITAYNGKYELDKDGNKIEMNDPLHSKYTTVTDDHYLYIESTVDGEAGKFTGEIVVHDNDNTDSNGKYIGKNITNDTIMSKEAIDDIHLEIFDEEMAVTGGSLKPMIDNIKTDSNKNSFKEYKDMLDNFAKKLSDFSAGYIETSKDVYVHGTDASQINSMRDSMISLNLFSGADVKSLKFNDSSVNTLSQDKLDYLATIQWKKDIDFDGTGLNDTSFSKYYQTIRASIADNRENVIFREESQSAVTQSMQSSYEKLTKVDKDEEMVNLIKFQAAYSANAKVITTVDAMLQTLLNIKR